MAAHMRDADGVLCTETSRLSRIENKIDQLSETLVSIARVEERVHSLETTDIRVLAKVKEMSEELEKVKSRLYNNTDKLASITRFFWVVVGISLSSFATVLVTKLTG